MTAQMLDIQRRIQQQSVLGATNGMLSNLSRNATGIVYKSLPNTKKNNYNNLLNLDVTLSTPENGLNSIS